MKALVQLGRYLIFFLVAAATIYFFYLILDVVITFLVGAVLAFLLYHPVNFLERKRIKRSYAVLSLYVVFITVLGIMLYFAIPGMIKEARNLAEMYPRIEERAEKISEEIDGITKPREIDRILNSNADKIREIAFKAVDSFISGIYTFLSKAFIVIIAPILAFYILVDWEKIKNGFLILFSPRLRREIQVLANDIDRVLIDGIKGSIMVAAIVGILVGLSAFVLGVRFPLIIGLLAGVTNLIPYFGPVIGGIPAVAIAYTQSVQLALYQTIALILVQQIESNIITPRVLGGKLGMHPLLIIFALLAGASLAGIWGMLFAVPVASILKVSLSWLYLRFVA